MSGSEMPLTNSSHASKTAFTKVVICDTTTARGSRYESASGAAGGPGVGCGAASCRSAKKVLLTNSGLSVSRFHASVPEYVCKF